MQTIVTDVRGVCLSVTQLNLAVRAVCAASFGAAFVKLLWPCYKNNSQYKSNKKNLVSLAL